MYDSWQDFCQYDGLTGYGKYWISRLPSKNAREGLLYITQRIEEKISNIPEKEQTDVYCFLHDLHEISDFEIFTELLEKCREWDLPSADICRCFPRLGDSVVGNIVRMYQRSRYFSDALRV